MRQRAIEAASIALSFGILLAGPVCSFRAFAGGIPPPAATVEMMAAAPAQPADDLQLEVFVNGTSSDLIAAFSQDADGTLAIEQDQLRNVGIYPSQEALRPDGLVDISKLPGVAFEYDPASQSIYFDVEFDALSARVIDAHGGGEAEAPVAQSSYGALMNYTVFASTGSEEIANGWDFDGVSGWLEGRAFSRYGVLSSSWIASTSSSDLYDSTRLDTTWSYSNPQSLITYTAGDFISGGLSWTRPVRLGGFQVQRNFDLRPDLVTIPLPDLSGSAAVPSTVDVYVNNARNLSQDVPAGPFEINNLPVITGAGTARVVVRDALGRETVTETPFFASANLLAPGLFDFSAEAGFARRFYGSESNEYDQRFMASGTARYGISDKLTLESHLEGGGGLVNGGAGAVFGLGAFGVGSLAGSASYYEGRTGFQIAASAEFELADIHVFARTQRSFGDYTDIAGVTAEDVEDFDDLVPDFSFLTAAPPRALDQLSISTPLRFDPATLNLSFTNLDLIDGGDSQIVSLSLNRPIGARASAFATAFTDLQDSDSYGVFAGLSVSFGNDIYASTGVTSDSKGTVLTTDLVKSEQDEIGSYGWRLRDSEGAYTNRAAAVSYRSRIARVAAGVEQFDDRYRATAEAEGAVVFAGRDVFLSPRINDAFAVVDAGAPDVEVEYENRPVGRTNRRGKLLLPDLRSYEENRISIDPTNLPVDASVGETADVAVPADRSGAVVKFDVETHAQAALVVLRDETGAFVETGSSGTLEGGSEEFVVGYDGQAYISGLGKQNRIVVEQPSRGRCEADFSFQARSGEQVSIPDTVCRATQ